MVDYNKQISEYIDLEIETLRKIDIAELNNAMNVLENARLNGYNIFVFGNGGSASTAAHMENDFNKGISENLDIKYRFHCLSANMATIMALANDYGYENVFVNQLENRICKDDVIIAISGSGNSRNIIKAVKYAKEIGCIVIGLTGYSGGELRKYSDVSLHVPLDNMQVTEDIHLIFNHLMMNVLCKELS